MAATSRTLGRLGASLAYVTDFVADYDGNRPGPDAADFVFGNPQEMAMAPYVEALTRHLQPQDPSWFAYKLNESGAQDTVAASLVERTGLPYVPDDVFMTTGGFAAIAVTLRTVLDPGDEVVFCSPPWFFYELLVGGAGGVSVKVPLKPPAFDLDPADIAAAITPRTRAVILNSPNNPTGRVYTADELGRLAQVLEDASRRNGRTVYLLSDEAYNRIVFDGRSFTSPATVYPATFVLYSYGKTLLTPGQRVGYIATTPGMADIDEVREAVELAQIAAGFAFPNALLQHALGDLEPMTVDVGVLQRRRDRMVGRLRELGYELASPEGTFYLLPRSPVPDDRAFADLLRKHDAWVLPGAVVELPGWFRISLTANDGMVERGLGAFEAALGDL
ncbi:MAG: aminotransferase class I/II-fold pyridoxal phosphate-dependent enzyme [Actinomycetes bacterium]